jgi:hypothetical protein
MWRRPPLLDVTHSVGRRTWQHPSKRHHLKDAPRACTLVPTAQQAAQRLAGYLTLPAAVLHACAS